MARKAKGAAGATPFPTPDRRTIIAKELARIARLNKGTLTPEHIVDMARDPNSPLHQEFDWNIQSAAEKHWLDTARRLIRYVTVVVVTKSKKITVPYYIKDPHVPVQRQGYCAVTSKAIKQKEAQQIMLNEFERAESAIDRARAVSAQLDQRFPGISDQLEDLLEKLIDIRGRFKDAA